MNDPRFAIGARWRHKTMPSMEIEIIATYNDQRSIRFRRVGVDYGGDMVSRWGLQDWYDYIEDERFRPGARWRHNSIPSEVEVVAQYPSGKVGIRLVGARYGAQYGSGTYDVRRNYLTSGYTYIQPTTTKGNTMKNINSLNANEAISALNIIRDEIRKEYRRRNWCAEYEQVRNRINEQAGADVLPSMRKPVKVTLTVDAFDLDSPSVAQRIEKLATNAGWDVRSVSFKDEEEG